MSDGRPLKAVLACGASSVVQSVYLAESTWVHIRDEHGEVVTEKHVTDVVTDPTHVHQSKKSTGKQSVIITNDAVTTASGKPIGVIVKLEGDGKGYVSTAFPVHPSKFGPVIWSKGTGNA